MSVFKVHLNNIDQGQLDTNPADCGTSTVGGSGALLCAQMQPSIQRTIYVTGPNLIYRKLADGATFTDCNYWKRFAYPQLPLSQAFIEVLTDDGSVYSDNPAENTFPIVNTVTVEAADTFTDNYIDILGTYNSFAVFTQLKNTGTMATQDVQVQLNGSSSAVFTLEAGDTQIFNSNDLSITYLAFDGGSADTTVEVIMSIKSVCSS